MVWQKEVTELKRRKELAKQMGGSEAIAKQHARGKFTIRERIDKILDSGSFEEINSLTGAAEYDDEGELKSFTHTYQVQGLGSIDGRRVAIHGGDFTVGAGARTRQTIQYFQIQKLAVLQRIPLISFNEGVGASLAGTEETGATTSGRGQGGGGWSSSAESLATIPIIQAALGSLAGGHPVGLALSHFSIMTKRTSLLVVSGPALVKQALGIDIKSTELGDYKVHAYQSGLVDNVAEDEEDAFSQIKHFLSYLPQNVWQQPPRIETGDDPKRCDEELLSIIPRDPMKQYDIRQLINHVVDKDSVFERQPFYGREAVTILARINGYPVAILANDVKWFGGALTHKGVDKMIRFVDIADTFHLPIVYLMDCRGFMIGPQAEKEGIERWGARLAATFSQTTVPKISILLRRSFGVAGSLLGMGSDLWPHYVWPSAEIGALALEGGVELAYKKEIEAAPDPEAKRKEVTERVRRYSLSLRLAEQARVDEVIDPRDTRPILCKFARHAQEITATQLGPKYRLGIRP